MEYVLSCLILGLLFDGCLSYSVFFKSIVPNYKKCGDLCVALNDCVSSNYSPTTGECELSRDDGSPSITRHSMFMPLQQTSTACSSRPCGDGQFCINIAAGAAHLCLNHRDALPCDPPVPTPGTQVSSWTTYMHHIEAVYVCAPGYTFLGGSGHCTCANSQWSSPDIRCEAIDCGEPDALPHMELSLGDTSYGSTATYSCDVGYVGIGNGDITCQLSGETGVWSSSTLSCQLVECSQPDSFANMAVSVETTLYQSTATYSCDVGYNGTGSGEVTCQETGMWSTLALSCPIVECGEPVGIANMGVSVETSTYNATANYTCDVGYTPNGTGLVTCQDTGTWTTPLLSCQIVDCGEPNTTYGTVVSVGTTTYGSIATYSCDVGFNGTGSSNVTCQDTGQWTTSSQSCWNCGAPARGRVMVVNYSNTTYGSQASYECSAGFVPTGDGSVTCNETGQWTEHSLTCRFVDCGTPTDPRGYFVTDYNTTYYGSVALHACTYRQESLDDTGRTSTCTAHGTWSAPTMTCTSLSVVDADLSLGTSTSLQCTDRVSSPSILANDAQTSVACDGTEILTGCSYLMEGTEGNSDGVMISLTAAHSSICTAVHSALANTPTVAHARCCSMAAFKCEYLQMPRSGTQDDDTTTRSCKTGFYPAGCLPRHEYSAIDGVFFTERGCAAQNAIPPELINPGIYGFTICCSAPNLECTHVTSSSAAEGSQAGSSVSVTCPLNYTMTSCQAHTDHVGTRGAAIQVIDGVDTCFAYNGQVKYFGAMGPKAIAGCCRAREFEVSTDEGKHNYII